MKGRVRHLLLEDAVIDRAKVYMKVRGIPSTTAGLKELERIKKELRAQLECGLWTHPLDIFEIKDGITRADSAYDYLYCMLNKDYSHYDDFGRVKDHDEYDYTSFDDVEA